MSAFAIRTQLAPGTSYLGACENDLARNEDKKHDFRFDHTVNEPREKLQHDQLRYIRYARKPDTPTSGS